MGPDVSRLAVGDRVVCLQTAFFGNFVKTRERLCWKMRETDSFVEMATIPVAYYTSYCSLFEMARLQKREVS